MRANRRLGAYCYGEFYNPRMYNLSLDEATCMLSTSVSNSDRHNYCGRGTGGLRVSTVITATTIYSTHQYVIRWRRYGAHVKLITIDVRYG